MVAIQAPRAVRKPTASAADFAPRRGWNAWIVTNPPYGERIEVGAHLTWSEREHLRKADFDTMTTAEWNAAKRMLHEMRPQRMTEAHRTEGCAELVCSNSFRGESLENAVGLLKEELRRLGVDTAPDIDLRS